MRPQSQQRGGLIVVLGSLTAIGPLSIDAYLPALPTIEAELGANPGAGAITLSSFFLGLAGAQLVWGTLADRIGRRPPLLAGLMLYVVGAALCGFATSIPLLAAARLVQGIGAASTLVVTRTLLRDLWSGAEIARVMSLMTLVMGVAPVLAPIGGGALLTIGSWRAIFAVLAAIGVALTVISFRTIPETKSVTAPETWWSSLREVFRDRSFLAASLAAGSAQAGMFAYIAGSPDVFVRQLDVPPLVYSLCFGFNAVALVSASQWNRRLLKTRSPKRIAQVAIGGLVVSGLLLVAVAQLAPNVFAIEALLFVFVGLQGMVMSNLVAIALETQGRRAGIASAVMGTLQFAISATASAIVATTANGTAMPMAATMLGCAAASALLIFRR